MKKLYPGIHRFLNDEEGVTAIEYALIAALIAVVIITGATAVGTNINNTFSYIANKIGASHS
jgi:pilus assembly protein Flp/PilA